MNLTVLDLLAVAGIVLVLIAVSSSALFLLVERRVLEKVYEALDRDELEIRTKQIEVTVVVAGSTERPTLVHRIKTDPHALSVHQVHHWLEERDLVMMPKCVGQFSRNKTEI